MAKDFRAEIARIHRGLNRLEKVLLETRRTGAFVPRSVFAVLAGGGARISRTKPVAERQNRLEKPGSASLIHTQRPKSRTGGQQYAVLSSAVSGMRAPQRSAQGRQMRTVPPRAQKRSEAAVSDERIFFRLQPSREKVPRLRLFAMAAKAPGTSVVRLATVKKELWNR